MREGDNSKKYPAPLAGQPGNETGAQKSGGCFKGRSDQSATGYFLWRFDGFQISCAVNAVN